MKNSAEVWGYLLGVLKILKQRLPPATESAHHEIRYAQYGNDEDGWEDRLAIVINGGDITARYLFLDPEDFSFTPEALVHAIIQEHNRKDVETPSSGRKCQ